MNSTCRAVLCGVVSLVSVLPGFAGQVMKADNATPLNDGASWDGGVVPSASDVAAWDSRVGAGNAAVDIGGALTWDGLLLADPAADITINGTAKLTLDGGAATDVDMSAAAKDLTLNVPLSLAGSQLADVTGGRTLTLNGATAVSTLFKTNAGLLVASGPLSFSGDFRIWGGTAILRGNTLLSAANTDTMGIFSGTLVLDGGTFNMTNTVQSRFYAGRTFATSEGLLIVSNGTHRIEGNNNTTMANFVGVSAAKRGRLFVEGGSLAVKYLRLSTNNKGGQVAGEPDEIVVNGGVLTAEGTSAGFMMATPHTEDSVGNSDRSGRLTVNGGRFEIPNGLTRIAPDTTVSTHGGAADIFLNGGVWAVKQLKFGTDVNVSRSLTFDGGTLEGTNALGGAELLVNAPAIKVRAGGAFLRAAAGTDCRATANFEEDSVSPGGSLVKTGPGRLILSGTNTLSGQTIVSNGVLGVGGVVAAQSSIVVTPGAGLSLADGAVSTLAPAALRMGLGTVPSRLELEVAASGSDCDRLVVPAGAWFQRVALDLVALGTRTPVSREGDFTVLAYEGTAPALSELTWGNPSLGFVCTFTLDAGTRTVIAHVRADPSSGEAVWASTSGGAWSTAANWNFAPVSAAGNGVTFGATLAAPDTVTLDAPFTLGRLTFNNSNAYTLSGAGSLTFDNGASDASISASGGNHTLALPLALGSSLAVAVSGSSQIVKLASTVSGTGSLTKTGSGDLELAGDNTYSGGTILSGGNLTVREAGASFGTGPIRLSVAIGNESGRLRNRSTSLLTITNDVVVAVSDASLEPYSAPIRLAGLFDFNGGGSFQKAGPDELIFAGTTQESGSYKLNIRNGSVRMADGCRFLITSSARDTIYLADGATVPRFFTVDAGAEVLAGGLYTGSAPSNTVVVNGGSLTLAGGGSESGLIRTVADMDGVDRIFVNSGALTIAAGRWLSLGVRGGGAEIIVNGGTADIGYLSLGVRNDVAFASNGAYTYSGLFINGGMCAVNGVLNWMGDVRPGRTNLVVLSGGTLRLPATFRSAPASAANFSRLTLNGGTLALTGLNAYNGGSLDNYLSGLDTLIVDQGGAVIDTLGNSAVVTQAVLCAEGTSGGLTKRGAGALTFTGASAYAGATVVEAGALRFAAGAATTGLTLSSGTQFSLRGSTFDALALTSASLGAGARIDLDVSPDGAACDTLALPADATVGPLVIGLFDAGADMSASRLDTAWPIFSYAGTPPDVSGWQLAPECFGEAQFTTNTVSQTIEVTLVGSERSVSWAHDGPGDWSTAANWAPTAPAASGASVRFGSAISAAATVTVDGAVSVAGLFFDRTYSYTLAGSAVTLDNADAPADIRVLSGTHCLATPLAADDGAAVSLATGTTLRLTDELTGGGTLDVSGGGTLALDGTNHTDTAVSGGSAVTAPTADSFGGPLALNDASVTVAQGGALSQTVALGAGGGTFSAGAGQTLTLGAAVSGTGGLTKTATGILDLGANAGYDGATVVEGGTARFTALPLGPLTLGRGTFAFTGTGSTAQPVTINPGTNAAVMQVAGDLTLGGTVTALSGGLFKRGAGTLRITGATENRLAVSQIGNADQVAALGADGDGPWTGAAGLSVADGTLILGAAGQTNRIAGEVYVGLNTTTDADAETAGELIVAGGYTEAANFLCIGRNNGSTVTAPSGLTSRVTVQDGTLVVSNLSLSANTSLGGALYTGRPELAVNGGTLQVVNQFYAGNAPGSVATITVNGGALSHVGLVESLRLGQGGGEGILRVTGGSVELRNDLIVGYGGAGNTGTVELAGGELTVKRLYSFNTASYSRVLFNGGVFKPTGGGLDTTIDAVRIGAAPAIFDTSLWAGSAPFALSAALAGADVTDGGLVKAGAGEMCIDAAQAYAGPTVVSNGTLWVRSTGSLPAASALTVAPGATFRIGNLPTTNVTVSALTLGAASDPAPAGLTLSFDYATGTSDRIDVNGDVVAHGAVIACLWRGGQDEGLVPNGRYELIRWTGNGPSSADAFSVTNTAPGKDYALAIDGQALVLTVGPSTSGTGAYVWSAASGGNWSDAAKWVAAPGAGAAGAVVRFDTTITGDAAVTLDQDATVGQLYLNSSNAYALAGAGHALSLDNGASSALVHLEQGKHAITAPIALAAGSSTTVKPFTGAALALTGAVSGDGGLVKDGAGELSLGASGNTFTGGVRLVSYGPLVLTNGASAGTGPVAFESTSTLRTGGTAPVSAAGGLDVRTTGLATVDVAAQAPLTASGLGVLAGTSLTKTGAGELIFAGSATVESDTSAMLSIKQGTVRFASGSDYRIGQTARDGVYLANNSGDSKGVAVDAGATVSLAGLYTAYGSNTLIAVDGQLEVAGTVNGDAVTLRVQDNTAPDRLVVNAGGVLATAAGSGFVNVGVRGPAELLVNGGAASLGSVALGYHGTPGEAFGGRYGHVRVTGSGQLDVADRWWWMADSNNASRVNWLLADGGGTARLPNTLAVHGTGWTILGLDDGTLQAAGTGLDAPVAGNYLSGLKTFFVGSGGGTVDTDGKDVALPQTIACDATPAFTKAGAGTLTLGQTLKWPGDVDMQAGVLSGALTSGVACAALPTNLLARYSSEGGPGIDSSGNTRHGAAWGSALTAVTDPFGGSALNFPTGSIIAMPMDAVMRGMGTYTVSMWVKAGSVSGTGGTFFTTRMGNSNDAYQFMLRINSGKFRYMATGSTYNGWANNAIDSTSSVPVNVWFHCAAVVTGGTSVTLYLNGQLEKTTTGKSGLLFCPPDRPLGGLGFGIGHPYLTITPSGEFTGQLDDVQIFNRALSGAEVAALAAAPTPVVPTLRVANGASAALQGATAVRTLSGEGYVAGGPLTVLESASPGDAADTPAGAALLADALVLSDGITYHCNWSGSLSDALHTGSLTIGGAGTLDLGRAEGQVINGSHRVVLATYDTIAGAENLVAWSIINAGGNGYEAAIVAENGEVVLTYRSTRGTLMLFK